jgi:hypothetical protein
MPFVIENFWHRTENMEAVAPTSGREEAPNFRNVTESEFQNFLPSKVRTVA